MFTFSMTAVHSIITRGRIDAFLNGGFRNPNYGLAPGKDEQPGLWLVGDEGVYLLSNGKLAEGQRPLVVYAEECDPKTNPDYWHYKRQHFGADDGIDFLDAAALARLFAASPGATHLRIATTDTSLVLTPIRR
ncbi:DUF3085 domain-containing protein [Ancylobacter sp. VNQ12]|uniref:DUF3085 domain-containing protein n=1 Tax=Ancylobacter sp. VNQ12 TaxID=3400920 RepID=UPI000DB00C8D|nr:MAG: DUF3085 domain-containing protein [Sphingomonas hengshuiensis]